MSHEKSIDWGTSGVHYVLTLWANLPKFEPFRFSVASNIFVVEYSELCSSAAVTLVESFWSQLAGITMSSLLT